MDKRINILLEAAESDSNNNEALIILMNIITGIYQWMPESFYFWIPERFRDVHIKKNDEKVILEKLVMIINKKGKNMNYAMKCISAMQNDKAYQCAEKLFLQEDWSKYPDFLVTLIFFLSILDDKFKKHLPRVIEYYKEIDDPFFRECVGNELKFYGYL